MFVLDGRVKGDLTHPREVRIGIYDTQPMLPKPRMQPTGRMGAGPRSGGALG